MPSCNTYHLISVSLTVDVGVSLHGCSSKAQPLLLTLDEGYLLTATVPDLQQEIPPLGPPAPAQPLLLGLLLPAVGPGLGRGGLLPASVPSLRLRVAHQGHCPWPRARSFNNLATWCHVRDTGSIPGSGRSPGGGHGNPLQYSCLENPIYRGAWLATIP